MQQQTEREWARERERERERWRETYQESLESRKLVDCGVGKHQPGGEHPDERNDVHTRQHGVQRRRSPGIERVVNL
jgi:hypothetical protein